MPHLLHPYKLVLGTSTSSGDPSPVINWDFLQSQSLTSFSRTSNATLFDSTGKLTYAANNLLLNTATLSTQTVTTGLQAGVSVILSFSGTGSVAISGGYTGSLAGTGVSDRVSLKFTTTTNSLTFTVTGSVTSAQLEVVTYQTTPSTYTATTSSQYYGPRYPYAYNGTTWDAQGLLVEAAGTNNLQYSETFSTAWWTQSGVTLSGPAITAPNGVSTSTRWNTASGYSGVFRQTNLGLTTGTYTYSFFIKPNGTNSVQFWVYDGTSTFLTVDCNGSNGTYTVASGSGIVSSKNVSGGWYRFAITFNGAVNQIGFQTFAATNLYIWGAQLEAGDLSSYIPNLSTGTTTRNADTSLAFSAISLPTGLSFSRASNAMQYDAAGRLTYAPNNLLTQSNTFSSWSGTLSVSSGVADPFGGTSASTLTASAQQYIIRSYASADASTTYLSSFWVRRRTGSGRVTLATPNNGQVDIAPTSSWQQYTTSGLPSGTTAYAAITLYTSGDAVDVYGATLSAVTYETVARPCDQVITTSSAKYGPRYDYDPLTRLPKGLLIEEGRTNLNTNTNMNTGWLISNVTPSTSGSVTGPDNATFCQTVSSSTGGLLQYFIYQQIATNVSGNKYTASAYVKFANNQWTSIAIFDGVTWRGFNFDLINGVAGISSSGATGNFSSIGNGWYRIWVTATAANTGAIYSGVAVLGSNVDVGSSWTLSGAGQQVNVVFAQAEAGSFPTSYIPNPGIASGIRSADIATLTGTALTTLKGTAGSAIAETGPLPAVTTNQPVLLGSDLMGGGGSLLYANIANNTTASTYGGTAVLSATLGSSSNWSSTTRAAVAWSAGVRSIVANAGTVQSDANGFTIASPSTVTFACKGDSTAQVNSWVRKFAAWNVKLADAKLQQKSVVGATL